MISIEIQEWQELKAKLSQLQQQVFFLKNENTRLKKLASTEQHWENNSSHSHSSRNISFDGEVREKYQMDDVINQNNDDDDDIKLSHINLAHARSQGYHSSQMINICWQQDSCDSQIDHCNEQELFSGKNNLYPIQEDEIRVSRKSQQSVELKKLISNKSSKSSQQSQGKELSLIQEICLFGPTLWEQNLSNISFKNDDKQLVEPALYYPQNSTVYKEYGNYLFPKKVRVKPTQKDKIPIQANKTIFKSSKRPDCNIFIFQGNEQLHPIKAPNKMLQTVNPSKWLYGIVLQFNDFVFQQINLQQKQRQSMKYINMPLLKKKSRGSLLQLDLQQFMQQQIHMETVSLKDIQLQNETTRMYRSTFCLCIFTYFPFIDYLKNVITAIFDQVKLKRIQNFPRTKQFKDCDIFYFISELENAATKINNYFLNRPVKFGKELSFSIGETLLQIDLSEEHLYKELYGSWSYRLIKMMDRDTFYEIYCMVMLQQSVSFVCENQRTLTLMILLFSSMMTKPFVYPYPVVSVLFTEELLQTPFTSIVGINESQEWLSNAIQNGTIDHQNKHFVVISQKQVKIRRTPTYNLPKSEPLRKIFTRFYKRTEPSSLTNILLRRDTLSLTQNNSQKTDEYIVDFFVKLQIFYHQNIFMYMPSHMKLAKKEQNQEEVNKVEVRNTFLNEVEKEYKKANPNYWKDEFIKEFVKTEVFSIYLMTEYDLQV